MPFGPSSRAIDSASTRWVALLSAGRQQNRFQDQPRSPALLFWSCGDVLGMGREALPHEIEPIVAKEHFIVDKEGGNAEDTSSRGDLIAPLEFSMQIG